MSHQITVQVCEFKYSYVNSLGKRKFGTQQVEGTEDFAMSILAKWAAERPESCYKLTRVIRNFGKVEMAPDADEQDKLNSIDGASWDAKHGVILFSPNW